MKILIKTAVFTVFCLLQATGVYAGQPAAPVITAVQTFLEQRTQGLPGKVEIRISQFDERNQLPVCTTLQTFLPTETNVWGQISVGVQCTSPTPWTVYVPARVSVIDHYLVANQAIRAGQIISHDTIKTVQGDLTTQPANTLTSADQAVGHNAKYAIAAGNTLRSDMLRLPPVIRQGQQVRIIGKGEGFQVSNEGRAMNNAAEGEQVRVRLHTGQVISGTARNDGTVELAF